MEEKFMEKRESPRLKINYLMKYGRENGVARFHAFFNDISEKGLRFLSKEHLPRATPLFIELPTEQEPLKLSGRVVWQNSLGKNFYELGVSFEEVSGEKKTLLCRYIDTLKGKLR
ncbi:MAG: PilZ domain-containing protein [Candidatus Omnitrophica bacterium]|nr:PilZ domain-containing protein [Candidatus Omnitrophota bacterium]